MVLTPTITTVGACVFTVRDSRDITGRYCFRREGDPTAQQRVGQGGGGGTAERRGEVAIDQTLMRWESGMASPACSSRPSA